MTHAFRWLPVALGLMLAGSVAAAPAAEVNVADQARSSVRASAEWLARGVDSWFGDTPFENGGQVRDGRLSLALLQREGEDIDVSLRFNARFRLPNLHRRSYLFFGQDDEKELIADTPDAFSRQRQLLPERRDDTSFFAGLGLTLREAVDFRVGVRGPLKPYVQLRFRHDWVLDDRSRIDLRETLFWTVDDHVGLTSAVSYERALHSDLSLRWLSVGTITQQDKKFEWSSIVGAYRQFGPQRVLSLEALIRGRQGAGVGLTDYGLQARWEQPLHEDWLIGELLVGHFWPRPDASSPRRAAWALGGRLLMRF